MKFRRNIKEEKLFHKVALFSLIAEIVLLTIYFITFNEELVRFILLLLFVFPLYFLLVHLLRKSFVEFQEDKIILINGNGINIVININEIEKILEEFNDPNTLHGKEAVQALYHMMGMEIDYDDIPL